MAVCMNWATPIPLLQEKLSIIKVHRAYNGSMYELGYTYSSTSRKT